ncbi:hypothetical protein AB0B50_17925 [Streptomyces sp. NPDC041068]|uniref:hypothetical protein n=1 Tax=Streptomyces sp. NPDC041068 TaxID=3155130 RepID=UPI00340DCE47
MADEQYKWLDRDAAERLLRGEPLEGVDPHVRAQSDRLAQALGALAAEDGTETAAGADPGELPGEAAALAAFRAARAEGAGARPTVRSAPYATSAHEAAAGETVRLARAGERPRPSRWGRPVRFGIAAALAGCMIGGVAVAAGAGVLPSPFGRHDDPGPAASASPVATPEEEPSASPSDRAREPSEDLTPDETTEPDDEPTREPVNSSPPEAEADGDNSGATQQPGTDRTPRPDQAKEWYRKAVTACRAYRSGELQGEKRRRLEEVAKGAARVEEFCGRILGGSGSGSGSGPGDGGQQGGNGGQDGGGGHDGDGDGDGENGSGGDDDGGPGGDSGGGSGGGDSGGFPGPPMSSPSASRPVPTASYSALPDLP